MLKKIVSILMSALVLLSVAGCTGSPAVQTAAAPYVFASAKKTEYPTRPETNEYGEMNEKGFAEWMKAWNDRAEAGEKVGDLTGLTKSLFGAFYEEGKNLAYSPMNIYIALAMLAETTAGETRAEILSALGAASIDELRESVKAAIKAETFDDGKSSCLIANSLWTKSSYAENGYYKKELFDLLAEEYSADSFTGEPTDPEYTAMLRDWLNEHTKGLLKDAANNVKLPADMVLAIASTIYFKAAWEDEFYKDANTAETFHAPSGDIECEFMHAEDRMRCYIGDGFTAVKKELKEGAMWFILPDEGREIDASMLAALAELEKAEARQVRFSMPKLDVSSELDLAAAMRKLGVSSCLSPSADFSPLTDADGVYVSSATHAARVTADEEGVEAAAFTVIICAEGFYMPEEPLVFTLDRPFIFVVTGMSGEPLFVGAVNNPAN